ncbi:MAG TPA: MotA/TolQ/ExbB proton channel family protein [Candidatus Marinimicrobia bacterium]|nr:MotA/TolQ/ExbB proton channel family protein [Candidatus Neomarinimicrobiota bacterium]HRS51993.1 MotA/TolQ/ExbB proton channel family protein [Candidatus Neomarinimicrobiota bacterium]HRU91878.1 MotA/TolQ/ExbB proton channel family protein [Candidatus Neomarinimicrobiota bacterium]
MDIATIFGIIAGTALIIMGIAGLTTDFKMFWNVSSIFIVVGGSFASTMISYSVKEVLSLIGSVIAVFKKEKIKMTDEVEEIVGLASVARKSMQDLEKALPDVKNPFLRDGLQMVVDGYNPQEIREILETRIENRASRERGEANVLRTMGKYSPAYGMLGTLIGLIVMLYGMAQISTAGLDPMEVLGKGMGAAIVTTFYGVILANLIFNPMAVKFESRIQKQNILQTMLIEGVLLLHARKHPLIVREKLNSYLRPRDWQKPEETK